MLAKQPQKLYDRIREILESARTTAARSVNIAQISNIFAIFTLPIRSYWTVQFPTHCVGNLFLLRYFPQQTRNPGCLDD